jgi:hypothetical protein
MRYTVCAFAASLLLAPVLECADVRVGIIGLDTSHVVEFTKLLNDETHSEHVSGARVVAAFKGGSPDVHASASRLEKFTSELSQRFHVVMVNDIPTLCEMVDAILLESVDGRVHLEQVRPVFRAHKRVFIDKPLAAGLADAAEIVRLGRVMKTSWFSASSARFAPEFVALRRNEQIGPILGVAAYGPAPLEPSNPGLLWYGIHAVEALYTVMGAGCESVTSSSNADYDLVVGKWKDGRIGTVRGIRKGKDDLGVLAFGEKTILFTPLKDDSYAPLVREIVRFFQTGEVPVHDAETLETIAFIDAAERSRRLGGVPVQLEAHPGGGAGN